MVKRLLRNHVGQASILCSVLLEKQGTFFHGIFCKGKAHSCHGVKKFVGECLKKIQEAIRQILLPADRGFYDGDFLNYLAMRRVLYAILVKLYP